MSLDELQTKRIYQPPSDADGLRLLVDRLWPRCLTKEEAQIDGWLKDLAPSTNLRKWFGHDPRRWATFCKKYSFELEDRTAELERLRSVCDKSRVTLLFGARDALYNNAVALRDILIKGRTEIPSATPDFTSPESNPRFPHKKLSMQRRA